MDLISFPDLFDYKTSLRIRGLISYNTTLDIKSMGVFVKGNHKTKFYNKDEFTQIVDALELARQSIVHTKKGYWQLVVADISHFLEIMRDELAKMEG